MTEWKHELIWPCEYDLAVYQVVMEPPEDPSVVESMKDVESCTVLNKEWVDGVYWSEMDVRLDPPIPGSLKYLLKSKTLGWIQDAKWYPEKGHFDVKVIPHIFTDLLNVTKLSIFSSHDSGTTRQDITMRAQCDIPLVGRAFEKFILSKLLDSINEKFAQMHSAVDKMNPATV